MEQNVIIPLTEYQRLLSCEQHLEALCDYGVQEWQYYEEAIASLNVGVVEYGYSFT